MNKDFQDRIDDYIFDRMSVEDRDRFEAEVNSDDAKKEQLEFTRNVKRAVTSREEKLARIREMRLMYYEQHIAVATGTADSSPAPAYTPGSPKRTLKHRLLWASGIAAILAVGLFTVNTYFMDSSFDEEGIRGIEDIEIFDPSGDVPNGTVSGDTNSVDTTVVDNEKTNEGINENE